GAAVGVSMAVAHRPGGIVTLVIALEISVAIDEVASSVAKFLQWSQDLGTGSGPIGGRNQTFEAELAQELNRFLVKLCLRFEQEPRGVLVTRRFLAEYIPKRAE